MSDEKLNLIVMIADTTRADFLGCYGSDWVKTPNLDRMAEQGVLFENCYADGLPTIPERRVFFTGKSIIPMKKHGGWKPLADDDVTITELVKQHGYLTAFFTDTYHYFRPGLANFHRGFDTWEFIRGQESDPWKTGPADSVDPRKHIPAHHWSEHYDGRLRQYLLNTQHIQSEDDYFCGRTFNKAMNWLENNSASQPFFLFIDTFDPHEPWDPPKRFRKMYRDDYPFERYLFGYGIDPSKVREEEYPLLRDLYAAEVSFVDMWVGKLLDKVKGLGMLDNTIIVFSTDHGTHIGEQGCLQKTSGLLNSCVAQLPLIIQHPDTEHAGKRIKQLVSSVDFAATFLGMLGIDHDIEYERKGLSYHGLDIMCKKRIELDGANIWDMVTGTKDKVHDRVFTEFPPFAAVRDEKWHYFQHRSGDNPGKGPCLYDLDNDPNESANVFDDHPDIVKEMRTHLEQRLNTPLPGV